MTGKKQISLFLYGMLVIILFQSLMIASTTFSFINSSVITRAEVISVTKGQLFYKTVLRFGTENNTLIETDSHLILKPKMGESIEIRYQRMIPSIITKNVFHQVWFDLFKVLFLLIFLGGVIYILHACSGWKLKRNKEIKNAGNHIYTRFKQVEAVIKVTKNGRHPYQIISEWKDGRTNKTYLFKSEYIWDNPIEYILDKTIKVMIDSKNKKKYLMDLSFLPQQTT